MTRWLGGTLIGLLLITPGGRADETGERASAFEAFREKAALLRLQARAPVEGELSPLYAHVTRSITSRMTANVAVLHGRRFRLPTVGFRCATTAPGCGRPTLVGCRRRRRPTVGCRTTAITCGRRTTAPNCGPLPPRPTANNCKPRPTANNCKPPTTAPGCGMRTTAMTCGCGPGGGPGGGRTTAPFCR